MALLPDDHWLMYGKDANHRPTPGCPKACWEATGRKKPSKREMRKRGMIK